MTTPLINAIEAFVEAHDMPAATFGRLAMRDPHFVRDVRNGRRVWPETDAKVRAFIAEYQPKAAEEIAA